MSSCGDWRLELEERSMEGDGGGARGGLRTAVGGLYVWKNEDPGVWKGV